MRRQAVDDYVKAAGKKRGDKHHIAAHSRAHAGIKGALVFVRARNLTIASTISAMVIPTGGLLVWSPHHLLI
jgi:hypothetical protein